MIKIGKLNVPALTSVNNHTTATPFDVPWGARQLWVQSDIPGVTFAIGGGTGTEFDTFAADADSAQLEDGRTTYDVEGAYDVPLLGKSPIDGASAWVAGATYAVGDVVSNGGFRWRCSQAGTSNLYGTGPTGQGNVRGDGTCNWTWLSLSAATAAPDKSVVRVAAYNPTGLAAIVRVYVVM